MSRNLEIPFCRSEFLQDFSIELGRSLKGHQPFWLSEVQINNSDRETRVVEGLALLTCTPHETGARLIVYEDRRLWVDVVLWPTQNNAEYRIGFYCSSDGFTHAEIIEAFRDTISVSTRLCYGESPLPILRRIWKYAGKVKISGELGRPRMAQPQAAPSGSSGTQVESSGSIKRPPSVS